MAPKKAGPAAETGNIGPAFNTARAHVGTLAGRISGWMTLAVVMAAPWLFSAGEAWVWLSLCIIVNLALILSLTNFYCRPESLRYAPVWTAAYPAILLFMFLQAVRFPEPLIARLSPLAADAVQVCRQIFADTELSGFLSQKGFPDLTGASISLAPLATRRAFYLATAYFGVLVTIASHYSGWRRAQQAATLLAGTFFLLALFSITQHYSGTSRLYGYYDPGYTGRIFGTFTNRNHHAAFMNMAFGLGLALVFSGTTWGDFRKLDSGRQRVSWLLKNEGGLLIIKTFMTVVIGASACMALSRGAMVSLGASVVIIYLFSRLHLRGNHVSGHFVAMFVIIFVSVLMWLGWEGVAQRMGSLLHVISDPMGNARVMALRDTLSLFAAMPVFGCGAGAFRHVFPLFTNPDIGFGRWMHAHNDIAELLAEGGVVFMLLIGWAFFALFVRIWRGMEDSDDNGRLFVTGLLVGILAMLLHSLLDFSLHRPANPLLFAALVGFAIGGSQPDHDTPKIRIARISSLRRRIHRGMAVLGILLIALISLTQVRELKGELAAARHHQWGRCALKSKGVKQRQLCIREAVYEGQLIAAHGAGSPDQALKIAIRNIKWLRDTRLDPEVRIELADQALLLTALAVQAAPTDFEYWLWLARACFIGNRPQAASVCLKRARQLAPVQQPVYLYLPPSGP